MRLQIEFAHSEEFSGFMRRLANLDEAAQEIVHSVFIDLHPVWKALVDYRRLTGMDDDLWPFLPVLTSTGPYDPDDSKNMPAIWLRLCQHYKKREQPFLVRLCMNPQTSETSERRRTVLSFVRDANREFPFFIGVEDREPAEFATGHNVEGGYRITATSPGTLGGFLKDQHGKIWGVTCGHVARAPQAAVSVEINHVSHPNAATVVTSNFGGLPVSQPSAPCNPYVRSAVAEVDGALLELSSNFNALDTVTGVGKINAILTRTQLNSGDAVCMCGASSGAHDYVIGAYGVTCRVRLAAGGHYCFANAFEIYAPANAPGFVPGRVAQALVPRPMPGDSGAWICCKHTGSSFAYFGNLIAVQGALGICTFADALTGWAQSTSGLALQPL
jgi:hypothetical protein